MVPWKTTSQHVYCILLKNYQIPQFEMQNQLQKLQSCYHHYKFHKHHVAFLSSTLHHSRQSKQYKKVSDNPYMFWLYIQDVKLCFKSFSSNMQSNFKKFIVMKANLLCKHHQCKRHHQMSQYDKEYHQVLYYF